MHSLPNKFHNENVTNLIIIINYTMLQTKCKFHSTKCKQSNFVSFFCFFAVTWDGRACSLPSGSTNNTKPNCNRESDVSCQRSHNDVTAAGKVLSVGDAKCIVENYFSHSLTKAQTHTHTNNFEHVIPTTYVDTYRRNSPAGKTRATLLPTAQVSQY